MRTEAYSPSRQKGIRLTRAPSLSTQWITIIKLLRLRTPGLTRLKLAHHTFALYPSSHSTPSPIQPIKKKPLTMSAANPVEIIPPIEGFLSIAGMYESEIREATRMQAQEDSTSTTKLGLSDFRKLVETEFFKNHHEKVIPSTKNNNRHESIAY